MKHRNDIYGDDLDARKADADNPAIPAATVVLLREASEVEVLMLHKTSKIAFGGMWVFPGGRIDPEDFSADGGADMAARNAAVRETREETGIVAPPDEFVWFSHWTPPPSTPRRFATWFFAAPIDEHRVRVDGGEIQDHRWLSPAAALAQHAEGAIDLAPPTWVTLHQLSRYDHIPTLLERLRDTPPRYYQTRLARLDDGTRVAMWHGDAGYRDWDATVPGDRHRLVMRPGGFVFENSVEDD
ncbi:MAG: NUDIX hydrolase [Pseudomonadales bacterium]